MRHKRHNKRLNTREILHNIQRLTSFIYHPCYMGYSLNGKYHPSRFISLALAAPALGSPSFNNFW